MVKMKSYTFEVWVHPLFGGDDYGGKLDLKAPNLKEAKSEVENWLKKRSAVTNDYRLIKERQ